MSVTFACNYISISIELDGIRIIALLTNSSECAAYTQITEYSLWPRIAPLQRGSCASIRRYGRASGCSGWRGEPLTAIEHFACASKSEKTSHPKSKLINDESPINDEDNDGSPVRKVFYKTFELLNK